MTSENNNKICMSLFGNYEEETCDQAAFEEFERDYIAEMLEADTQADKELMASFIMHQQKKESRRYNRMKRRTSRRDYPGTRTEQHYRHMDKIYFHGDRDKLLDDTNKKEMKAFIKTEIYDVRTDKYDSINPAYIRYIAEDCGHFELLEPWHNDALVLFVFDECSARFIREECLSMSSIFELETLRTYIELGKCRLSINPDFSEYGICSLENFFRLVIDEDAYDLLMDMTYRRFLCKLAAKLYELHTHEDLHIRYLRNLQR